QTSTPKDRQRRLEGRVQLVGGESLDQTTGPTCFFYFNSPPTAEATSPPIPPPSPPPPTTLSICPAIGAGNLSFKNPSTVVTAVRALSSEMPVRCATCLTSSSMVVSYLMSDTRLCCRDATNQ